MYIVHMNTRSFDIPNLCEILLHMLFVYTYAFYL